MRILIVEDSLADFELTKSLLEDINSNESINIDRVEAIAEAENAIAKESYDLVLLDLGLPDGRGVETVEKMSRIIEDKVGEEMYLPLIIYTGIEDYSIAKKALNLGAKDFLVKGQTSAEKLDKAILYATYSRMMPKRGWLGRLAQAKKKRK